MSRARLLVAALIVVAIAVFFAAGGHRYFSFESLKQQQAAIDGWYRAHPAQTVLLYFAAYVAVTGLSLPGATLLTLAGGAVFGLLWGTVIVSFASSLGATLAFLASRFVLRDWVRSRFGERLKAIDEGLAKEGAFYLFTLRLLPVVPFFLINLRARPVGDARPDLLLGEPDRHARRHARLRERRHAARAPRLAARHPLLGAARRLPAARHLPADREEAWSTRSRRGASTRAGRGRRGSTATWW